MSEDGDDLPEKRGRGQPPHKPTEKQRETVRTMTAYGIPQDAIAAVVGISEPTLRKHYAHEIATAQAEANARVALRLFEHATGDSVAAAIFWMKVRAGWSEKQSIELSGAVDLSGARDRLSDLLTKIAPSDPASE
jgi:hypothetical protein